MTYTKVYCCDCGNLLSRWAFEAKSKRCVPCDRKFRFKDKTKHPMYGKKLTKQHIRKIVLSRLGKKHSKKTKKVMRLKSTGENSAMYGKHHTLKSKNKIRVAMKGSNNPNYKNGDSYKKAYCECCGKLLGRLAYFNKNTKCVLCYLKRPKFFNTDIELIVKKELTKRRIKFKHPYKVGKHPADFYIQKYNLVIECDGDYWHTKPGAKEKDRKQNAMMRNAGYFVKRLRGSNILNNKINYDKIISRYATLNKG